jgi:hypothetical protein
VNIDMKKPEFDRQLTVKLDTETRRAIEILAERGEMSIGGVTRLVLSMRLSALHEKEA